MAKPLERGKKREKEEIKTHILREKSDIEKKGANKKITFWCVYIKYLSILFYLYNVFIFKVKFFYMYEKKKKAVPFNNNKEWRCKPNP